MRFREVAMRLGTMWAASAIALAPAAARPGDLEIRPDFELRGERGAVAFRDGVVTMFSPTGAPASVRVGRSGAGHTAAHLPRGEAIQGGLCDPLDQLDLGERDPPLRAALPPAAKVKDVRRRPGATIAVYSLPGERQGYEVWVALLAREDAPGGWRLLKMKRASQAGHLCGAYALGTDHLLVLVEQRGAAETLVAYGLAIAP